jgi:regulator of protease activity HflC (stomatin/prohibitin superfamily)
MLRVAGEFEKLQDEVELPAIANAGTRVRDNETLYQALERMGLMRQANRNFGGYLIREGEIGMCSDNGVPFFLAPGRHSLWSALNTYKGRAPIAQRIISLGESIQIVTVDEGEIGLSKSNGRYIILQPGQHILRSPQRFVNSARVDANYVHLGIHHRISVPIGNVAIAHENGRKIIITPEQLNVKDTDRGYIHCTEGEMFKIDSPTFRFDPLTGFKSIQMEDIELPPLIVNTSEFTPLSIVGAVRYKIVDPVQAFLRTDDVEGDIIKQANATLTSVFSQLSIKEIASSIASTIIASDKGKEDAEPHDMLHHATKLFMNEFQKIVSEWGVDAKLVNITSLQPKEEAFRRALQTRAEQSIAANSNLAVVAAQTEVVLQEADRNKRKAIIDAEGAAEARRREADALVYTADKQALAAEKLQNQPLAQRLALMKGQAEIARSYGNNTVFASADMGNFSMSKGGMTFFGNNDGKVNQDPVASIDYRK